MYGAARDITERKKSEDKFRGILESAPDAIIIVNTEGKIQLVNSQTEKLFGYKRDEILGKEVELLIPARFKQVHPGHRKSFYADPKVRPMGLGLNLFGQHKDGKEIPVEISLSPIETAEGLLVSAAIRDITEKKKVDEALRNSELFLNSIVENIPNMLFVKDAKDLKFVRFNKAGEELLGYSKAELIGKNDYDFFPKNEADFFTSKDKKVLESKQFLQIEEETIHTKYKGERILETKKIPILDSKGKPLYLLGISNDITDLKKILAALDNKTKELERSNKELEQFAYVASHDLQEPLRTISNYVDLLEEDYSETKNEIIKQYFTFITSASSRMQILIKDLLDFSRVGKNPVFVSVDCNKILKEVIAELESSIKESKAKITFSVLPVVTGIEIELKRVFQNLISNALKFRRKDVVPEIEITSVETESEYVFSIKDNGIGIEEKSKSKLFVIFQRLHPAEEYPGTGIGLATAKKIVDLHKGKIWIESKVNEGSVFYFTIPKENLK
ncbi:MAG: hypothetical protein A3F72_21470 [Bacteroidetes bacterium RIFCSPLOWO2_12_FULL_35_15]|nr:MAG: hypothetical protein A3F72_21470 [Bacteroidetes bacterium RIFCSPLOWO2_12_FULL_35_15]